MDYCIHNGELYHYGVKGMKWGVRRARKKAAKAQKKWDDNVQKNWVKAYNRAAEKDNATIEEFNSRYKDVDLNKKSKQNRKYIEDYCKRWNDMYVKELEATFGKAPIDNGRKWCDRVPMFANPADWYESF